MERMRGGVKGWRREGGMRGWKGVLTSTLNAFFATEQIKGVQDRKWRCRNVSSVSVFKLHSSIVGLLPK